MLSYVDDILIASRQKTEIEKLKKLMNYKFELNNIASAKAILRMEITRNKVAIILFLS